MTLDIEKAFDSVKHLFLNATLESMALKRFYQMDTNSNTKSRILYY